MPRGGVFSYLEGKQKMKQIALAVLITAFAMGTALAQKSCESQAVGKGGEPLVGAAKTSFLARCKREVCASKAVGSDGKWLEGAAKDSFMAKCEKDEQRHLRDRPEAVAALNATFAAAMAGRRF
jgi:hypothetical protein